MIEILIKKFPKPKIFFQKTRKFFQAIDFRQKLRRVEIRFEIFLQARNSKKFSESEELVLKNSTNQKFSSKIL